MVITHHLVQVLPGPQGCNGMRLAVPNVGLNSSLPIRGEMISTPSYLTGFTVSPDSHPPVQQGVILFRNRITVDLIG